MKCPTCGTELPENTKFCTFCGTAMETAAPPRPVPTRPVSHRPVSAAPAAPAPKLLGPWAYFGLQLLFSIPIVGFIFLIIFSLDNSNLNRRNYARSFWCALLVGVILSIICGILFAVTGVGSEILSTYA